MTLAEQRAEADTYRVRKIYGRYYLTRDGEVYSINPSWTVARQHIEMLRHR